jgi:hypothetical protein
MLHSFENCSRKSITEDFESKAQEKSKLNIDDVLNIHCVCFRNVKYKKKTILLRMKKKLKIHKIH